LWFLVKRWIRNTEIVRSQSYTIVSDDVKVLSLRPCGRPTCQKVCRGYSPSFIPVYEILIKCETIVKPTRALLRTTSKSMFDDFGTCSKH